MNYFLRKKLWDYFFSFSYIKKIVDKWNYRQLFFRTIFELLAHCVEYSNNNFLGEGAFLYIICITSIFLLFLRFLLCHFFDKASFKRNFLDRTKITSVGFVIILSYKIQDYYLKNINTNLHNTEMVLPETYLNPGFRDLFPLLLSISELILQTRKDCGKSITWYYFLLDFSIL